MKMKINIGATVGGGIGFTTLLQIAFIVLKLCNVITWKWVFVLMPLIVDGGLIVLFLLAILIALIAGCISLSRE